MADTTAALQSSVRSLAALLPGLRALLASLQTQPGRTLPESAGAVIPGGLAPVEIAPVGSGRSAGRGAPPAGRARPHGQPVPTDPQPVPTERLPAGRPRIAEPTPAGAVPERGAGCAPKLTMRQREVLTLLARGMSNRQIARALGISEKTVKNHMHAIFSRLALSHRTQAALYASKATASSASCPAGNSACPGHRGGQAREDGDAGSAAGR